MRTPVILLRFAVLAAAAQFATACTTMTSMNPFDGDPNGPPPAPHMLAGAYGGDEEGGSYRPEPRSAPAPRDEAPPRRVADSGTSYDRSYGTNSVESSELPPPSAGEAAPAPDRPADDPIPRASTARGPGDGETRTLSTTRSAEERAAAPASAPRAAATHKVVKGEELADIADTYGVREVDIIALNSLRPPYALKAGQELQIPARETASADAPVPKAKPEAEKPSRQASAESGRFDWPVSGKVISGFGAAGDGLYNEGINIAVPVGTPVKASAAGTVRYAGNELKGYGNLVLIEHAGGFVTAYAHNNQLKVKRGDKIARGDVIALSGKTGNVKTPQLHFEIRKGTESVDPRKYLVSNDS